MALTVALDGIDGNVQHIGYLGVTDTRLAKCHDLLFFSVGHLPVLLYRLKVVPSNFLWTAGGENHGRKQKKPASTPQGMPTGDRTLIILLQNRG